MGTGDGFGDNEDARRSSEQKKEGRNGEYEGVNDRADYGEGETEDEGEKQHFKLGDFEGPLDLLLFLVRKSEVNIYDIPIAQITEQYMSYLEYATKVDLDNITEFYVMASTLIYIKSRLLLPVEVDLEDELEDPRQELVERLIEYEKYRKLSELMRGREQETQWVIERTPKQRTLEFLEDEDMWEQLDVWELLRTFGSIMKGLTPERVIDLYEEVSVNEKITLIRELVATRSEFSFSELIVKPDSLMDVVCAFLALLDTVKDRLVRIFQNRMFGDIRIRPAEAGQPREAGGDHPGGGRDEAVKSSEVSEDGS